LLNTVLGSLSSGVAASTSSYESIASATGTGSSGTITFTSIPSTYASLQIRYIAKESTTASAFCRNVYVQFNSDTGTNYVYHNLKGNGSTASATGATGNDGIYFLDAVPSSHSTLTNITGVAITDIHDYASTTKNKTLRSIVGVDANIASTDYSLQLYSGLWLNTNAITSISIKTTSGNFTTASTFALYGIKG
jgi:hypothetical protein